MAQIVVKRGSREQIDAAATAGFLNPGEPYWITDEKRFAVGVTDSTYEVVSGIPTLNGQTGPLQLSLGGTMEASALDPSHKAPSVMLSNARRTASFTGAAQAIAIGDLGFTEGKHCFEVKFVSGNSSSNAAVGVGGYAATLDHQIGYDATGEVGVFQSSGNIYADQSLEGSASGFSTAGAVVGVAVDADNRLVWFRIGNGPWNGSEANDPATGFGGVPVSGSFAIHPMVGTDDPAVFDFIPVDFTHAPPAGFGSWSSTVVGDVVTPGDVLIESPVPGQAILFNGSHWYNGNMPATGGSALIGEVKLWPAATAPENYLICDGADVSRTTFAALFALFGEAYGEGDNATTFNLPDLRGRVALGVDGSHALGSAGGAETVTLTRAQMPAYPIDNRGVGALTVAGGGIISLAATPSGGPAGAAVFAATEPIGANIGGYIVGGATQSAVNITPPHIALNYIIYAGV